MQTEPRRQRRRAAAERPNHPLALSLMLAMVAAVIGAPRIHAQEAAQVPAPDKHAVTWKTERIIVFKDGYNLVLKRGKVTTDANGEAYTEQVPPNAILGSLWITPKEGTIRSMVAGWTTVTTEQDKEQVAMQTLEILQANRGKAVMITLSDNSTREGVIHKVLTREQPASINPAHFEQWGLAATGSGVAGRGHVHVHRGTPTAIHRTATFNQSSGNTFVLRTAAGDMLLPVSYIKTLQVKDMVTTIKRKVTTTKRSKRLTMQFEKPSVEREVLMMYFQPGVRWIPTYRVSLNAKDPKKKLATVEMQAEVLNEAEDLDGVPMDIVVGVPNFRFRTLPSPLSLEAALRNTLQQAAPQLMGQFRNSMSNALYTQRSGEVRRNEVQANVIGQGGTVNLPNELTASGAQDLFVYSLPKLKLKKGERAAVPIFKTEVPYRDVYTWDVRLQRTDIETAPSGSSNVSPLKLAKNEVWRQIELTNTTSMPWTTGAAMIMLGRQPLAQELLTYTSPKDVVRIPVTVSVDTRGTFDEKEIGRKFKALTWGRTYYAKIDKQAKVALCNHKAEDIEVEVTLRLGGKVDKASHEGKIALNPFNPADWNSYRGDQAVNNSSEVRWKLKLKPAEVVDMTIDYHYFSRHY